MINNQEWESVKNGEKCIHIKEELSDKEYVFLRWEENWMCQYIDHCSSTYMYTDQVDEQMVYAYFIHPESRLESCILNQIMESIRKELEVDPDIYFYFIREGGDEWEMRDIQYFNQHKNYPCFIFNLLEEHEFLDFVNYNNMSS